MFRKSGSGILVGLVLLMAVFGVMGLANSAWAGSPEQKLYYSAKTTMASSSIYTFRFSLWNNAIATTQGNMLWSETKRMPVLGGYINTYLGSITPLNSALFSQQLWVQADNWNRINKKYVIAGGTNRKRLDVVSYAMFSLTGVAASRISGQISTAQIADLAVTNAKISNVAASKITGTIGTSQIAAAAITEANISSHVSASSPYVLVVATSGGNYSSVQAALTAIGGSLPTATSTQPYLIKVMPGTYTENISLKSNVHVQGSGIGITKITNVGGDVVTISDATNARLSQLTVENSECNSSGGIAVLGGCDSSVVLDNVQVIGMGTSGANAYGIRVESNPTISNSSFSGFSLSGNGYGIYNNGASPTLSNSGFGGSTGGTIGPVYGYGIYNTNASSPMIIHCTFSGSSYSIYQMDGGGCLVNCQLTGSYSSTWSVGHRLWCYDASYSSISNR